MIVREWPGGQILLVRQTDHAVQCGQFARHWGNEEVPPPEPRAAVVLAAAEHDRGWRALEDQPKVDPATGRPYQFFVTPIRDHAPTYTRGVRELATENPYAGLLVSLHATRLRGRDFGDVPGLGRKVIDGDDGAIVRDYLAEHEQLQKQLWQELERSPEFETFATYDCVLDNFRRLAAWDTLSLHTLAWPVADGVLVPVPLHDGVGQIQLRRLGDWDLGLAPYPFDHAPLVTSVPAALVPNRRYRSDADFEPAWASAERITLTVTFSPAT